VLDLAGNALVANAPPAYTFAFTVSSASPSVTGVDQCGALVDADDLAGRVITVAFDRGVQKAGGGALDGSCLKLQLGGVDQPATVGHAAGGATATLTPDAPLQAGQTYSVVATSLVAASDNGVALASQYSCSFATQTVLLLDLVEDDDTTGYSVASAGGKHWQREASVYDNPRAGHGLGAATRPTGGDYVRAAPPGRTPPRANGHPLPPGDHPRLALPRRLRSSTPRTSRRRRDARACTSSRRRRA
jgi:hypothetical protein